MSPELQKSYEDDPRVQELIDMSMRLEGLPQTYLHACGGSGHQPESRR